MKFLSIIIGALLLASCSNMHTSGGSGTSGTSGYDPNKPHSMQPFDPNDPYHGG